METSSHCWRPTHQNWWVIQWSWVIGRGLCAEVRILLLLDLFLNLKLLELLLNELLLLLCELLRLGSRSLTLTHNAWRRTSLNPHWRLWRNLCHILLWILLRFYTSSRNDGWLQLWRLHNLFVRNLSCSCNVRCWSCCWFFDKLFGIFRRKLLWFRIKPSCHRLFGCSLRWS